MLQLIAELEAAAQPGDGDGGNGDGEGELVEDIELDEGAQVLEIIDESPGLVLDVLEVLDVHEESQALVAETRGL